MRIPRELWARLVEPAKGRCSSTAGFALYCLLLGLGTHEETEKKMKKVARGTGQGVRGRVA